MEMLRIFLLGAPRIELDHAILQFDTHKADALLAYLAVSGQQHRREALAALFWPENDSSGARAALRRTLSVLRKGIGDWFWEVDNEAIGLAQRDSIWVDTLHFRHLLASVNQHKHPANSLCAECQAALIEAADLYRGDFMSGFSLRDSAAFDEWQFFQAEELRRDLARVLELLSQAYAARGAFEQAITSARRWLALDELREEVHTRLMLLYAQAGQRSAALRQYRECVRILEQELGIPPLDETTLVYRQILNQQSAPRPDPKAAFGVSQPALTNPEPAGKSPAKPIIETSPLPLIGRAGEWDAMLLCHSSAKRNGWLAVIEGEAGIGKTRLAEDFIAFARTQGAQVFLARCYEGETGLAFGPIVEGLGSLLKNASSAQKLASIPAQWLAEAGRLQPEIITLAPSLPALPSLEGPGAQSRFFEGLRQVLIHLLSGPLPGILLLDDLHWSDEATLDFLAYLARRLENSGILLLLTWRSGNTENKPRLMQLLTEAQRRQRGTLLELERWNEAETSTLVNAYSSDSKLLPEQLRKRIYQESEGLPLLAVSYLGSLSLGNMQDQQPSMDLPETMRELWLAKVSALDEVSRQLLGAAALIGRSFSYSLLQEASGRSEIETINGLEKLAAQGLVIENSQVSASEDLQYDFTHEKLRQIVSQEISLARQRLLHRRIAEAMLTLPRERRESGSIAALIATHFQQAGLTGQAAEYYKLAGEQARALYANAAALAHFQAALADGHPEVAALHEAIGGLFTLLGKYEPALQSYETAAAVCAPPDLARLEYKLGEVHGRKGEWQMAECYYQLALADLQGNSPALQARILADWSLAAQHLGQPDQAFDLASQSLNLAQAIRDLEALSQAHNTLGMLARAREDYAEAIKWLNNSLQNAQELGNPGRQAAALNNLALVHRDCQQLDQALEITLAALNLCSEQGDRHREAALLNNLADLLHAAGRTTEAMDYLRRAVVIFAEIGVQGSQGEEYPKLEPEIWKLTEW